MVKGPPTMREPQESWVQSPGREDPLEEGTATRSSVLAWRTPWTEEPGGLQSVGVPKRQTWLKGFRTHSRILFNTFERLNYVGACGCHF